MPALWESPVGRNLGEDMKQTRGKNSSCMSARCSFSFRCICCRLLQLLLYYIILYYSRGLFSAAQPIISHRNDSPETLSKPSFFENSAPFVCQKSPQSMCFSYWCALSFLHGAQSHILVSEESCEVG